MNINTNYNYPNNNHTNFKAIKVKLNKQSPTVQKYLSTTTNSLKDIEAAQEHIDSYITRIENIVIPSAIRSYIANKFPDMNLEAFDKQKIDFFKDEPVLLVNLKERTKPHYNPHNLDLYITYNNKEAWADSARMDNRWAPAKQLEIAMGYMVKSWISNIGQAHDFFKGILEKRPEFIEFAKEFEQQNARKDAELLKKVIVLRCRFGQ